MLDNGIRIEAAYAESYEARTAKAQTCLLEIEKLKKRIQDVCIKLDSWWVGDDGISCFTSY